MSWCLLGFHDWFYHFDEIGDTYRFCKKCGKHQLECGALMMGYIELDPIPKDQIEVWVKEIKDRGMDNFSYVLNFKPKEDES